MSFNIVDIKVVTDYTDFSSTVRFSLNVPITATDADTVNKALSTGAWSDIETDLTKAVKASAPTQVQTLVAALIKAYSGSDPAPAPADPTPNDPPADHS